jgi:SAM-dependent methyltransferase
VVRHPHQFGLGIADIGLIDGALTELPQQPTTIEPVVDRPGPIPRSALSTLAHELHGTKGTDATLAVTGRGRRVPPVRPRIDHDGGVSGDTSSRPASRRHPSAGNLEDAAAPTPDAPVVAPTASPLSYPLGTAPLPDLVRLGPDLDETAMAKMVGHLDGRRVLELGCGSGSNSVAMAMAGARVVSVDTSGDRVAAARRLAEEHEVSIEFHHGEWADLAFERADRVDLCLAVYSLAEIEDISRVFRQVHRVLRSESPLILSLPHPLRFVAQEAAGGGVSLAGSYTEGGVYEWRSGEATGRVYRHGIGEVVTTLFRSNFRVDTVLEPPVVSEADSPYRSPLDSAVPSSFIVRSRKEGT